jgi:hypothetical protein
MPTNTLSILLAPHLRYTYVTPTLHLRYGYVTPTLQNQHFISRHEHWEKQYSRLSFLFLDTHATSPYISVLRQSRFSLATHFHNTSMYKSFLTTNPNFYQTRFYKSVVFQIGRNFNSFIIIIIMINNNNNNST